MTKILSLYKNDQTNNIFEENWAVIWLNSSGHDRWPAAISIPIYEGVKTRKKFVMINWRNNPVEIWNEI